MSARVLDRSGATPALGAAARRPASAVGSRRVRRRVPRRARARRRVPGQPAHRAGGAAPPARGGARRRRARPAAAPAPPTEIAQPLGTPYSLFQSVEATGRVQRNVVRTLDVRADGVVAARLGLEESTPLVHLERLRFSDEEPLADRPGVDARAAGRPAARRRLRPHRSLRRVRGPMRDPGDRRPRAPARRGARTRRSASCSARGRRWRRSRSTGSGSRARSPWSGATRWCAATGSV